MIIQSVKTLRAEQFNSESTTANHPKFLEIDQQVVKSALQISDIKGEGISILGEKMLNSMMKEMSKIADLSKTYTNQCLRATTINIVTNARI